MTKIFKYALNADPELEKRNIWAIDLELPLFFKVRHVGEDDGELFVWIELNPHASTNRTIRFRVFGTGWEINSDYDEFREFIGTIQTKNGYVWHIYMER